MVDFSHLYNQDWLIDRMLKAGYLTSGEGEVFGQGGQCFGIVAAYQQAFFARDIEKFLTRIDIIAKMDLSYFENDFEKWRSMCVTLLAEGKTEEAARLQAALVDTQAFFELITLYQSPERYQHLRESNVSEYYQKARIMEPLVRPVLFEESPEKQPQEIFYRYDTFDAAEWTEFLNRLEIECGKIAFTLNIGSNGHARLISYDPTNGWYYMDPNDMLPMPYPSTAELTKACVDSMPFTAFLSIHVSSKDASRHPSLPTILTNYFDNKVLGALVVAAAKEENWPKVQGHLDAVFRRGFLSAHQTNKLLDSSPTEVFNQLMDAQEKKIESELMLFLNKVDLSETHILSIKEQFMQRVSDYALHDPMLDPAFKIGVFNILQQMKYAWGSAKFHDNTQVEDLLNTCLASLQDLRTEAELSARAIYIEKNFYDFRSTPQETSFFREQVERLRDSEPPEENMSSTP